MKTLITLVLSFFLTSGLWSQAIITAVFDGPLSGGTPKGVEIYITQDIDDLTKLGISSANNGTGPTGTPEYTFPMGALVAGEYIYIANETPNFSSFFEFAPTYEDEVVLINGNDAIELFWDGNVIDVFGDVNMDGLGTPWEYTNGWAYRKASTGPDGSTFIQDNWNYSGVDALTGEATNATSQTPVPIKTYASPLPDYTITASGISFTPNVLVLNVTETVEWQNISGTHSVNGSQSSYPNNPEGFMSGAAAPAPWMFSYTFSQPGIYNYHCDPHQGVGMTGLLAVRPSADHYISVENNFFSQDDITISQGETVVWTNTSGFHNVNGSQLAYPDNPEDFYSGDASEDWIYSYTFNTPGVYDYHCDPHLDEDMIGKITVESKYKVVDMEYVREVDSDGVSVKEGEFVEVNGKVYGVNLNPGGLQFALIDDSNFGITVFDFIDNLGYTPAEGDELTVKGQITQFNGLIEISPEEIILESTANNLIDPSIETSLGEHTENRFVKLENLTLVDIGQWPGQGETANVQALKGADTIVIRYDEQVVAGPAPLGPFNVQGVGGQFDENFPYLDNYQVSPRRPSDIEDVVSTVNLFDENVLKVYPNPVKDKLFLKGEVSIRSYIVSDINGRVIMEQKNLNTQNEIIDLASFISGSYFLTVETTEGRGVVELMKVD